MRIVPSVGASAAWFALLATAVGVGGCRREPPNAHRSAAGRSQGTASASAHATGSAGAAHRIPLSARAVAVAYGLDGWSRVDALRFTFHVRLGDREIVRHWTWEPQSGQVQLRAKGADGTEMAVAYRRSAMAGADARTKQADRWFINDQYWLLFPLHLVWDHKARVEDRGKAALPIGSGEADHLIVSYPPTGGYTPGDMYELFVGSGHRIEQWIYRRGGSEKAARSATWEAYRPVGPLTLSLDHHGPEGHFRLWFTDVAVRLRGSATFGAAVSAAP